MSFKKKDKSINSIGPDSGSRPQRSQPAMLGGPQECGSPSGQPHPRPKAAEAGPSQRRRGAHAGTGHRAPGASGGAAADAM
jgi:hypothetical protein